MCHIKKTIKGFEFNNIIEKQIQFQTKWRPSHGFGLTILHELHEGPQHMAIN